MLHPLQKDKIAALADDDPLLVDVYLTGFPWQASSEFTFLEMDMIRRGEVSQKIFWNAFENPPQNRSRGGMLHWLRDSPWMDPESFLPLIRSWYQDLKRNAPPSQNEVDIWSSKKDIKDFLRVWGHPEDEVIMTEIGLHPIEMRLFHERLQRLRNGDKRPKLDQFFDYRNKTMAELRKSMSLPELPKPEPAVQPPPASTQSTKPVVPKVSVSEGRPGATSWSIVIVLVVAAAGLLWLLFKKRK